MLTPERVRVSYGSALLLGLIEGVTAADPTTVYLLTYYPGRCTANCAFCPQSRESAAKSDRLSRVIWPVFKTGEVVGRLANTRSVDRVCIQSLNYENVFEDVVGLAGLLVEKIGIPISLSIRPLDVTQLEQLKTLGVDRISIPLDSANGEVFRSVKGLGVGGPYSWEAHWNGLADALQVFGRGRVSTHLIVGLGETDQDLARTFQRLTDLGVFPGLFAFTPIRGTRLAGTARPPISRYRRIQLLHFLITRKTVRYEDLAFTGEGEMTDFGVSIQEVKKTIRGGVPFMTSGCPSCNRPFYNERPGGPLYNFPRPLRKEEIDQIEEELLVSGVKL